MVRYAVRLGLEPLASCLGSRGHHAFFLLLPRPQVVCAKCSDYRAELKYDGNRPNRVCLACYTFLTGHVLPDSKEDKRRGILEVRADGILPTFPFLEDSLPRSEKHPVSPSPSPYQQAACLLQSKPHQV